MEPRVFECKHCHGVGWYETDRTIENGNGWDEPRTYEYVEEDCPECDGTGWARHPEGWREMMSEWQPIETAPKDGTHIFVCFGPYDNAWGFDQRPPTVAHWFGPPDLPGLRAGGWYLSVHQSDSNRIKPTHWQPLPAPPELS